MFQKGTTVYDREKAFDGYTLWAPLQTMQEGADEDWQYPGHAYLIGMDGAIVHEWLLPYPTMYAQLLPDGHLLAGLRTTKGDEGRPGVRANAMGGTQGILYEADWDGKEVFRHEDLAMHHDFRRLPGGGYAYLAWEPLEDDVRRAVRGGQSCSDRGVMWCDVIREIDDSGRIVWEWHAKDHLSADRHVIGPIYKRHEWSHFNDLSPCANGDYVCSSRYLDSVFRISRRTGEIAWQIGSPSSIGADGALRFGTGPDTLGGPHDAHIIPEGLPGAGHLLCYDNNTYGFISRAAEFDTESGRLVWESSSCGFQHGRVPFSCFISGARRLPNGNTLICEGGNGRFYEVTPEKEVVWEYWRPEPDASLTPWIVFRCLRYAPDYAAMLAALKP